MEKVASTVMFPCRYQSSGCGLSLLHTDKTDHEETCEFRYEGKTVTKKFEYFFKHFFGKLQVQHRRFA